MATDEPLDKQLEVVLSEDPRFKAEAYAFVSEAVTQTVRDLRRRESASRHISGRELLDGIRALALKQFGPLALDVLHEWGVKRTEDFGSIVFNMVKHRLLGASDQDSPADFADVYDFNDAFIKPFVESGPRPANLPKLD